jgi:phosphatidylcholine synthase
MTSETDTQTSAGGKAAAWLVHGFTATGVVFALLALAAVNDGDFTLALLWLLAALAVDGIDGTLARAAHVKTRAPTIDGDAMDLIVDYLNYVFIPALFIWRAGLVPEGRAPWLAAAILVSALYCFCRRDMKTDDNYFRGFPALWNVVALYFYAAGVPQGAAAIIVLVLAAMTFAPVHFVHPFRVRDYGWALPALSLVWAAATLALLWAGWSENVRAAWFWVSAGSAAALVALGLLRTLRGPREAYSAA